MRLRSHQVTANVEKVADESLQQFAKQACGSPAVATRLDENIEDVAILIDGTPEMAPLSLDGDEDLVQVPDVAQPALATREPASVG